MLAGAWAFDLVLLMRFRAVSNDVSLRLYSRMLEFTKGFRVPLSAVHWRGSVSFPLSRNVLNLCPSGQGRPCVICVLTVLTVLWSFAGLAELDPAPTDQSVPAALLSFRPSSSSSGSLSSMPNSRSLAVRATIVVLRGASQICGTVLLLRVFFPLIGCRGVLDDAMS